MIKHILLLCLLGNPFELNLGGHQRTVAELINYFKDTPQLELTVITTNCSVVELTANHLYSNITICSDFSTCKLYRKKFQMTAEAPRRLPVKKFL